MERGTRLDYKSPVRAVVYFVYYSWVKGRAIVLSIDNVLDSWSHSCMFPSDQQVLVIVGLAVGYVLLKYYKSQRRRVQRNTAR